MAIKTFNPTTPSRRNMTVLSYKGLSKVKPEKSLLEKVKKTAGRNSYGRITVRHRGGGNKQKYRIIDFPLSNMVESGITKIGVITNANFRSLMDHVGTGKPWDLSRKNDGLYLLPPFSVNSATMWGNRIDAIFGNIQFLNQSNQDYVLMSDCNQYGLRKAV